MISARSILVAFALFQAEQLGQNDDSAKARRAAELRAEARKEAAARNFDEALARLRRSIEAGYPTPSDVLADAAFDPLRRDPDARRVLRELLRRSACETDVTMVIPEEFGNPMVIEGRILDALNNQPVAGARVMLFHTDNEGLYAPEHLRGGHGAENPRLFGFVRTDARGAFTVRTIRPASYPEFNNMRHVHLTIEAEGYGRTVTEFYVNGDPTAGDERRRLAAERGWPIVDPKRSDDGTYTCQVVLSIRGRSGGG